MARAFRSLFFMAASFGMAIAVPAQDLDAVRESLLSDIEQAQRQLTGTQTEIGRQRQALARELNAAQSAVLDLRDRAVAARRLADEETLSLRRIEERLSDWQEQSQFQTRLLASFSGRVAGVDTLTASADDPMQAGLSALRDFLDTQQSRLFPDWIDTEIVLPDGQLASGEVLELGPVGWYLHEQSGGLVDTSNETVIAALAFEGTALEGIAALRGTGQGRLTFDPTLSRAVLLADENETLLEHLEKGGIWVIPILLFALFATLTAVAKGVSLLRLPKQVPAIAERIEKALAEGGRGLHELVAQVTGMQRELVDIALQPQSTAQRDERLYASVVENRHRLEQWLGAIALTAAVSPLLGLLGTVSGMIATFELMTLFGSGDANTVSAGISEALVTTELGLVVAIPALLAHALMSRKVKSYYSELETTAIRLSQLSLPERER
jgi:biopolymer transport protein ExbB